MNSWDQAVTEIERATARLLAGLPDNASLIEDALARRAEAIGHIQKLASPPDAETLTRLRKAAELGNEAQLKLILSREQIRDNIARLNHASYVGRAFTEKSTVAPKAFVCEG